MKKKLLNICWLYPDLMNIYGDQGNIICLTKRCEWRNIEVNIQSVSLGDSLDISKHDLYFFGGGQDQQQNLVASNLQKKGDQIKKAVEDRKAVVLAICGGYQLLGKFYQPAEGKSLPGIGLFDAVTIAGQKRMIGNVVIEITILEKHPRENLLVGFENHSGKTYLRKNCQSLGIVKTGHGNNGCQSSGDQTGDHSEGAVYKTAFGTYLHGSLLPKNPHLADYLIKLAMKRNYGDFDLPKLDDSLELKTHQFALRRASQRLK